MIKDELSTILVLMPAECLNRARGCGARLISAQVAVGNTETVVRRNPSRGAPSEGYDAMIVPGRQLPSRAGSGGGRAAGVPSSEEYVIFDGSQALPLHLIQYTL